MDHKRPKMGSERQKHGPKGLNMNQQRLKRLFIVQVFSAKVKLRIWRTTAPPLADQIRKVVFDGLPLPFPGILHSHLKTQSTQLPFCCWRRQEWYFANWTYCDGASSHKAWSPVTIKTLWPGKDTFSLRKKFGICKTCKTRKICKTCKTCLIN